MNDSPRCRMRRVCAKCERCQLSIGWRKEATHARAHDGQHEPRSTMQSKPSSLLRVLHTDCKGKSSISQPLPLFIVCKVTLTISSRDAYACFANNSGKLEPNLQISSSKARKCSKASGYLETRLVPNVVEVVACHLDDVDSPSLFLLTPYCRGVRWHHW